MTMETAREVFRFSDTARAELEAILGSASARAVPLIEHYVAELHEPQRDADDGTRAARIREELGAIRAATASREALARALGNIGPDTARALLIAETLCHVEVRSGWDALSAARREDRLFAVVALVLAKHPAAPEALVSGLVQGIVNSRTEPGPPPTSSASRSNAPRPGGDGGPTTRERRSRGSWRSLSESAA
jgi:hypothetical protein